MGRTAATNGIAHYPMDADHTLNKKVRLLYLEFEQEDRQGGRAYWVWSCLLDSIYKHKGYYFDPHQKEELLLFANEHCKLPLSFIERVIQSALRLKLFNQTVYEKSGVLTSERIMLNWLWATYERRRKGTKVFIVREYFCISTEQLYNSAEKYFLNVFFNDGQHLKNAFPRKKEDDPRKNELFPRSSTHSIVYNSNSSNSIESLSNNTHADEKIFNAETDVSGEEKTEEKKTENQKGKGGDAPPPPKKEKKPKKSAEDSTPYWQELQSVYAAFRASHSLSPPAWSPTSRNHMKLILGHLKRFVEAEYAEEWNLTNALLRWNEFLTSAYQYSDWMQKHYSLSNMITQIEPIFSFIKNPVQNGERSKTHKGFTAGGSGNGELNGHHRSGKQPDKNDQRLQDLASFPARVQELANQRKAAKGQSGSGD